MTRTETREASLKLDNAFQTYAADNGDGFTSRDWQGAYEYREEGYAIAERAFDRPDRDAFIEEAVEAFDENARYLVSCAVAFRLRELADNRREAGRREAHDRSC